MKQRFPKRTTAFVLALFTMLTALVAVPIFTVGVGADVAGTDVTYTFSDYTAGVQYAGNEEHVLDETVTVTTTQAHFTTQRRLYSSSTHDGYAIISSVAAMDSITLHVGNKKDTLLVYSSTNGTDWGTAQEIEITSTSYNDYTVDIPDDTTYIKLDVKGTNQVRIEYMTVSFTPLPSCETCTYGEGVPTPATCTEAGYITYTCTVCGSTNEVDGDPATGHSIVIDGAVAASCTTPGLTEGSHCANCDDATVAQKTVPALGHTDENDDYVCDTCGTTLCEHNIVTDAAVGATCTTAGKTEGSHCDICGEVFVAQETIPAPGHTYDGDACTTCGAPVPQYKPADLADIAATDRVIIVATKSDGTTYALPNNNGTSAAPSAFAIAIEKNTITSTSADIVWNIVNDGNGNLTIYPAGQTDTWLYCTSANNGVRVGTNANNIFTLDKSGYLKHTATGRYLGVYLTQDWRCYTNTTGNTAGQTFAFYVEVCPHTDGDGDGKCDSCGAVVCTEHTAVTDAAVGATCTTAGLTEGSHCSACGEVLVAQETIPALGHTIENDVCATCGGTFTPAIIVENAYALAIGEVLAGGSYTLTGVITSIDTAYSSQYENITVTMVVNGADAEKPIKCYRMKGDGTDTIKVGDVITVTGSLTNYNGTIEFDTGCTLDAYAAAPTIDNFSFLLNKSVTANVSYTVSGEWLNVNSGAQLVFKSGESVLATYDATAGTNTYSLTLTPGQVNDAVTLELQVGGVAIATNDVSVAAYTEKFNASTADSLGITAEQYTALSDLLSAITTLGDATDGTLTDTLTEDFTGVEDIATDDTADVFGKGQATVTGDYFSIAWGINAAAIQDGYTLTVEAAGKTVANGALSDYLNADGTVVLGFYHKHFGSQITVTVKDSASTEVASTTLTFNAYLKALYTDYTTNGDTANANLVAALYQYGVAIANYANA